METQDLIHRLAASSGPTATLAPPSRRLVLWLGIGLPYAALVVAMMSLRPDLGIKVVDPSFVIEQIAALATGVAAGFAAFASIIPGYNRRILVFPLIPLAAWSGSLGMGCMQAWMQFGSNGLSIQPDWDCFPAIVLVGLVPAVAMALMLRRGAPLTPHLTTALGGLAAAGIGNFGLRLFHPQDASIMVLVWQLGTVFVLAALAGWSGKLLLGWKPLTERMRRRLTGV